MENNPDLQADNNDKQGNSSIDDADAMELVRAPGDPPEGAPSGGIELKEKGDEEEEEEIGDGGGRRREHSGVVRGKVEEDRGEEEMKRVKAAL